MNKKTIVIHHSADFDGIFCREIARHFLPGSELIGWDYGNPVPDIYRDAAPVDIDLYMLDISIPELMDHPGLIWIDHHKSAIEKFGKKDGYQIDGVSACRLAWQWFSKHEQLFHPTAGSFAVPLPVKQEFIDRTVSEPLAVRLAGEYDIWDKRDPSAELFQHGLRSRELGESDWLALLDPDHKFMPSTQIVSDLLESGKAIQYSSTKSNESIIKEIGFDFEWEGLKFLACNNARYNSHLFTAGLRPDHDACFGFKWTGKEWSVSLYHAPGKEQRDLSLIASKYGGGGHRGACGFRTKKLPFIE